MTVLTQPRVVVVPQGTIRSAVAASQLEWLGGCNIPGEEGCATPEEKHLQGKRTTAFEEHPNLDLLMGFQQCLNLELF